MCGVRQKAGYLAVLLLVAGPAACARSATAPPPAAVSTSPSPGLSAASPVVAGVIDWSRHVRDCAVARGGSGLGTRIDDVLYDDVTGDGRPDWLVVDECESSTSSWPQAIEVFDGAAEPVRLATLLAEDPVRPRDLVVEVGPGGRVTVTGRGLSPDAPTCCPDLELRRVFIWTGNGFALTESTDTPS